MTADHFDVALKVLTKRSPFRVFTVELHGGWLLEIDHAKAVSVYKGVAVFVSPGGVRVLSDHDSVNLMFNAPARLAP